VHVPDGQDQDEDCLSDKQYDDVDEGDEDGLSIRPNQRLGLQSPVASGEECGCDDGGQHAPLCDAKAKD